MSNGDDADLVRRLFEAFNARDVESLLVLLDPEAEFYPMRAQLEGRAYHGHDGLREMLADFAEDWETIRMDAEEYVRGEDAVVALGHLKGRGQASGVDFDVPMGWVWKFRDGKAVYGKAYSDARDALRAAGVERPI